MNATVKPQPAGSAPFPAYGGDMGALIRGHDWSRSPLGPIEGWSDILRGAVSLMLPAQAQIVMFWGPEFAALYNDAYAPTIGNKHPHALGRPAREHWTELWDDLEPLLLRARAGETVVARNRPFRIDRKGYLETVYFDISYSPACNARGEVEGVVCIVDETTERVVTEQRLREANERMQLALNSGAVIGTWVWDVRSNVLSADALFARSFGLDDRVVNEGIPFDSAFATIHPDDRDNVRALKSAAVGSRGLYRAEYRVQRPDGAWRWVEANGRCEFDGDGRPTRFPGVLIDIHERKMTEQALRASEARFRIMSDAMPGFAWTAEPTGMLDHTSQQWLDYSGSTKEQSLGAGWASFVHPDDLERAGAAWMRSVQTGEPYDIEFRLRRRDGIHRWFLARALPVRDETATIVRWVGTCNDIEDTVVAREVLSRSRDELEHRVDQAVRERNTIWNTTPNLICVVDRGGGIRSCNPAWRAVLGWSEAEVRAMSIVELEHPEDRARAGATRSRILDGTGTVTAELRFRHRDGGYRWIAWTATPDGDAVYAIGRDITAEREQAQALRNAEEQLRQAQKMEAVGQLTGGIAHDFNNLLTGIIGSLDLLRRRTAAGRTGDNDRFIEAAVTSANRAASLTQRLLAFSRRQSLDIKPVDLNALVSSIQDLLGRTLGEQVTLEMRLDAGSGTVEGDPIQIETALLNLAINARDAMPDGGTLTVSTENMTLAPGMPEADGLTAGDYVVLSVADTGTGMPQSVIERVFDPFFTTKPIGQGTGLGLSMVYGYAKQSRGNIRIESRVGEGTTVRLYLPCHAGVAAGENAPAAAAAATTRDGEVVLVVEDDPAVRMTVIEVLRELGYRTLEAVDGRGAIPILESKAPIDLLVTDVGLPGLNGRQVAEIARQHRPGLKVLFITGYAENAAVRSGFLDPGMELITKPFALDDLASRVRTMIASA